MSYHGWAVIRQADVSAQVYVNVSDWAESSGRQWSGNFESAPSAPPLQPGEAVLEAGDSQPAPITITSPEITSHNPVVYDGDFTGHGNPPSIIDTNTETRRDSPHPRRFVVGGPDEERIDPPGRRPRADVTCSLRRRLQLSRCWPCAPCPPCVDHLSDLALKRPGHTV